jgi:hypothetical protein
MILERFSAIVFVGDEIALSVYAALNVLLFEDLALGSLQQWMMSEQERESCTCNNQFTLENCLRYAIKNSDQVHSGNGKSYLCSERK